MPATNATSSCVLNWPPSWAGIRQTSTTSPSPGTAPTPPAKKTDHDSAKKWVHLTELARQREVEQRGREEVADLYE